MLRTVGEVTEGGTGEAAFRGLETVAQHENKAISPLVHTKRCVVFRNQPFLLRFQILVLRFGVTKIIIKQDFQLRKVSAAKKIHVINDVKEGFVLMHRLAKGETYILIENDLPDLFNEKK